MTVNRIVNSASARRRVPRLGFVGLVLSGAIALLCIWLVARNAAGLASLLRTLDLEILPLAFLAHAVALFAAAFSWHKIVSATGGRSGIRRDLHLYIVTMSARRLPGSLWGSALRMYWYRRLGGDWRLVGVASVLEVFALTFGGLILAPLGAIGFLAVTTPDRVIILVAFGLVVVALRYSPRLSTVVVQWILRQLRVPTEHLREFAGRTLATWIVLSVVTWIFGGLELSAIVRALAPNVPTSIPAIVTMWTAAGVAGSLITFVPGGFGVVEMTLTGMLSTVLPLPVAIAAALAMRLITTLFEVFWTVVGLAIPVVLGVARSRRVAT